MDDAAGDDVVLEILPSIRAYRSGRVELLLPTVFVPASLDPDTGVASKDVTINPSTGLSARVYLPPSSSFAGVRNLPVLVFYHGGGFCSGSAFSSPYHSYVNRLAAAAGILAVSADYRLAPEHPLPAAYDDSLEVLQWVAGGGLESADLDKIFVSGDSSCANIAHNVVLRLGQNNSVVEGLILLHPHFWGKEKIGSGVILKAKDADALWPFVCPGTTGLDDQRINPTAAGAPSLAALGCRRVLVAVAGRDLLNEDEGEWVGRRSRVLGDRRGRPRLLPPQLREREINFIHGAIGEVSDREELDL
ncbi:putative carboxylesterase 2 [Apostasia shenzhenica]|uniref:Putative carboxylesterase 2 n=1 Tax=Apostasia shenzhenica TaxID=1088818 RepID=A0A2I0A1R9_9ASPA|nr:putative carboxylesterase 2 [Apostasia shenzhenica]